MESGLGDLSLCRLEQTIEGLRTVLLKKEFGSLSNSEVAAARENFVAERVSVNPKLDDKSLVLNSLTWLLVEDQLTNIIANKFRPLLLHLILKLIDDISKGQNINSKEIFLVLSKLVLTASPDCFAPFITHLQQSQPFYTTDECKEPESKKQCKGKQQPVVNMTEVSKCCYMLLSKHNALHRLYDWSHLLSHLNKELEVSWYSLQSLCAVNQITGPDKKALTDKWFPSSTSQYELSIKQLCTLDDMTFVDYDGLSYTEVCLSNEGNTEGCTTVSSSHLHHSLAVVCNMLMECGSNILPTPAFDSSIVLVETTYTSLQTLALSVVAGNSVIVSGPVGCGKTTLIEYLSQHTQQQLIKVQLSEHIDSKSLMGTYCCTDTPGQFEWRAGPLTTAASDGKWLLLEDVDAIPMDILSLLLPIVEDRKLPSSSAGHQKPLHQNFRLFMTKRTSKRDKAFHKCALLEKFCTVIEVGDFQRSELKEIVSKLYPSLSKIADKLLDIYELFGSNADFSASSCDDVQSQLYRLSHQSKSIGTRDLIRWCHRISDDFRLVSTNYEMNVLQEALDCFLGYIPNQSLKLKLTESIGAMINISAEKSHYLCETYKAPIKIDKSVIQVGRVSLPSAQDSITESLLRTGRRPFAHTKLSCNVLESIASCVVHNEPVLLVGETGTGKTSIVQYLADQTGHNLYVINMSQQSDTVDLLGGYKPISMTSAMKPVVDEFIDLFVQTFSRKQNSTFLGHVKSCFLSKRWFDLVQLMEHTIQSASKKGCKLEGWQRLHAELKTSRRKLEQSESNLAFTFVEGKLVHAIREGKWVLLDEVNLAAAETLDSLCGLLDNVNGSITMTDRGDTEPISRHSSFRLFACMNPATDVGKKDLSPGIRNRFTELYVDDLKSKPDLRTLVESYLHTLSIEPTLIDGIVNFYLNIKSEAKDKLMDASGGHPVYSLRTLCRALAYASTNPYQNVQRSLYEAFCMSFLTQLDRRSHGLVVKKIMDHLLPKGSKKALSEVKAKPWDGEYESFEGYWIKKGTEECYIDDKYILTDTVKANMKDIARVIACGRHPILLQGETSVGKTSMVEYIAKASGNKCVRINNHDHTDIQEYIGSYVADEKGHLTFREGVLVDAMRHGYWIILDELNLAPSDVLEALNRLLDDNRELLISETQEIVKAHNSFLLFATQNPPATYGGRKVLSRAFRNRFVELHFDEIPSAELEVILHKRCCLPPTSCKKIIKVMSELQLRRRDSGLFAGKQGYITLRDVFRWGERYRQTAEAATDTKFDWEQCIVDQGFMLLAGRVRRQTEEDVILEVLEKCFKKKVEASHLFSRESRYYKEAEDKFNQLDGSDLFSHIAWTFNLTRLLVLVGQSLKFKEPVLLVGETGCGKTTICQYFAHLNNQELFTVNCHMHTEGSHFLGGLRPARNHEATESEELRTSKLFEWQDGPLVQSMKSGGLLLVDEISLADDSVLERLNSVLEPSRTLVLAEKAGEIECIKAHDKFRIVSTMNPSGDYGKKELSPALRNRFTEIWCPQCKDVEDYKLIIRHNLGSLAEFIAKDGRRLDCSECIVDFICWFTAQDFGRSCTLSVRDILAWVNFIKKSLTGYSASTLSFSDVYVHGACLVFIDVLGAGNTYDAAQARSICIKYLCQQTGSEVSSFTEVSAVQVSGDRFVIHPFAIPVGPITERQMSGYCWTAPFTISNCTRLLRALQLNKPILLEGSPGVGKTSLVIALAKASSHPIVRINLSEQTDLAELFGADLPSEDKQKGLFSWRDGLFLRALKAGHWIVLDELNLASQSVLEGLNACFDHRAEVFVPELGKTFHVDHANVKIFACQNPYKQGGGRKGLPKSFLNRFTQVYMDDMSGDDQVLILSDMHPNIPTDMVKQMVHVSRAMYRSNLPGEYNLRDLFRWASLLSAYQAEGSYKLAQYFPLIYLQTLRTNEMHYQRACQVFQQITGETVQAGTTSRIFYITDDYFMIGSSCFKRRSHYNLDSSTGTSAILHEQLEPLENLAICLDMGWMAIIDGPNSSGKTTLVKIVSQLFGEEILTMSMNSSMDTSDLLGVFEQVDYSKSLEKLSAAVCVDVMSYLARIMLISEHNCAAIMRLIRLVKEAKDDNSKLSKLSLLLNRIELLKIMEAPMISSYKTQFSELSQKLNQSQGGMFEWRDSILVEAVRRGKWLVIENAHLCNASVLDRLNSLLEPGGTLTITECGVCNGEPVSITPNKNFRLILTTNMRHADLSRAMKNRGVIISIPENSANQDSVNLDVNKILRLTGLRTKEVESILSDHEYITFQHDDFNAATRKLMYDRARMYKVCKEKGYSAQDALIISRRLYPSNNTADAMRNRQNSAARLNMIEMISPISLSNICQLPTASMLLQLIFSLRIALDRCTQSPASAVVYSLMLEKLSRSQLYMLPHIKALREDLVTDSNDMEHLVQVVSRLQQSVLPQTAFTKLYGDQIPMDLRTLPSQWERHPESPEKLQLSHSLNKLHMHIECNKLYCLLMKLPSSSWLQISKQYAEGYLDAKHLPHKIVSFFMPLLESFLQFVGKLESLTDAGYVELSEALSSLYTFMSCNSLVTAAVAWTDLQTCLSKAIMDHQPVALSLLYDRLSAYLVENADSSLYNNVWQQIVRPSPVDSSSDANRQSTELLYNTLANLNLYTMLGERPEVQNVLSKLKSLNWENLVKLLGRVSHILYGTNMPIDDPEQRQDLTSLENNQLYLDHKITGTAHSHWPVEEYWLLRVVLYKLAHCESSVQSRSTTWPLSAPQLLQLTSALYLSTQHPDAKPHLLNLIGQWCFDMTHASCFRHGYPFIHTSVDTQTKLPSDLRACSIFNVLIKLLTDDLTYSDAAGTLADSSVSPSLNMASPRVCLGQYMNKLSQLTYLCNTLWENSALFAANMLSKDETTVLTVVISLLESSLPESILNHSSIKPAVEKLNAILPSPCSGAQECVVKSLNECWIWLGYMLSVASAPRGLVDPVIKQATELSFINTEIHNIRNELSLRSELNWVQTGVHESSDVHPRNKFMKMRLAHHLGPKQTELQKQSVQRQTDQFPEMVSEASNLLQSSINISNIDSLLKDTSNPTRITHRINLMLVSLSSYITKLESKYILYQDIIQPHLNGMKMLSYGLKRHLDALTGQSQHADTVAVVELIKSLHSPCRLLDSQLSVSTGMKILQKIPAENAYTHNSICKKYLLLYTQCLANKLSASQMLDSGSLIQLTSLMMHYVDLWQQQCEKKAEDELKSQSLYKFKEFVDPENAEDEEKALEEFTRRKFPTYNQEFSDLVISDELADSLPKQTMNTESEATDLVLSQKELEIISELHCGALLTLASTSSDLAIPSMCNPTGLHPDRANSYTLCLNLVYNLLNYCTIYESDEIASLPLVSATLMKAKCQGRSVPSTEVQHSSLYDIYVDENIPQAIGCRIVLDEAGTRIDELLADWPDHPLLQQVKDIIARIHSFPVTDPLIKFSTGLELLLEKLQEWENNAARFVSVQSVMNSLSQLIIEWRKLELEGWKQSLNRVHHELVSSSSHYWYHLCSVFMPLLTNTESDQTVEPDDILKTVVSFIEKATLGDYSYRLKLLHVFTSHTSLSIHQAAEKAVNATLANNLYQIWKFYQQFEPAINKKLSTGRAAIEKKLKDYIKVARWTDMNYWSVKSSIDKSHKTLAKHMKEYHDLLVTKAKQFMAEDVSISSQSTKSADEALSNIIFCSGVAEDSVMLANCNISYDTNHPLECLPRISHLAAKMSLTSKKISSEGLSAAEQMAHSLDQLSGEVIDTVTQLQGLTVIGGDDIEKQKKQAKSIDLQKRKALAMLLKTLSSIGLSYRKGNVELSKERSVLDILIENSSYAVNLESTLPRNVSQYDKLKSLWRSMYDYKFRCLCRRSAFISSSAQPSQELGAELTLKLKGHSEHLCTTLLEHEAKHSHHTASVLELWGHIMNIKHVTLSSSLSVPPMRMLSDSLHKLSIKLPSFIEHVHELRIILNCSPYVSSSHFSECKPRPLVPVLLPPIAQQDESARILWESSIQQVETALTSLSLLSGSLLKYVAQVDKKYKLYTDTDYCDIQVLMSTLEESTNIVSNIINHFRVGETQVALVGTVSTAVTEIRTLISTVKQSIMLPVSEISDDELMSKPFNMSEFIQTCDSVVKRVLLDTQNINKEMDTLFKQKVCDTDDKEVMDDALTDGHLTKMLSCFSQLFSTSHTKKVNELLMQSLEGIFQEVSNTRRQEKITLLTSLLPFLNHYYNLRMNVVTKSCYSLRCLFKLLSILYNVFTQLITKGFCLPSELKEDDGDGAQNGEFSTSDDPAGLGDGAGAKDVSDQIESESQLDDAKRPEDRDKEKPDEPDQVPNEEKNAIEMSEDFEGGLEDAPHTEVDEEDEQASSGDEDEMDDQMGDIGDSDLREKLDDKLWGDENDQEEKESKMEEEGKGSDETRKEMVAKDDNPEDTAKEGDKEEVIPEEKEHDIDELDKQEEQKPDEYNENEKPDQYYSGEKDQQGEINPEEVMDLPDDMELDNKEQGGADEEDGSDEEPPADMKEEKEEVGGEEAADSLDMHDDGGGEEDMEVDEPNIADKQEEGEDSSHTDEQEPQPQEDNKGSEAYAASQQTQDTAEQNTEQDAADKGGETEADTEGHGQSESQTEQQAGYGSSYQPLSVDNQSSAESREQHSFTQSNENRTIGDNSESAKELTTIIDKMDAETRQQRQQMMPKTKERNQIYQHMKPDNSTVADAQAYDAAKEDQITQQQKEDEVEGEKEGEKPEDIKKHLEQPKLDEEKSEVESILPASKTAKQSRRTIDVVEQDKNVLEDEKMEEMEGAVAEETEGHGNSVSTIHTNLDALHLTESDIASLRHELEEKVNMWSLLPESADEVSTSDSETRQAWERYEAITNSLSHELCEQLRLILEPTQVSKLRGDYRTGKRLNMRKVIAYIASHYRKDKIWMRRSKPSKREYQIAIAVDDSSSMIDNHSKQLAFESLACISNALNVLQVGDISVVRFGEDVKVVHDFSPRFTWEDGVNVLRSFTFGQKKTKIAQMLDTVGKHLINMRMKRSAVRHEMAQLLLIVSDGRGMYSEGIERVKKAVRDASTAGIFIVFVIIDHPGSKDSILDIKLPIFSSAGGLPQIKSYMDSFPFPFYIVLRDINSLPAILADALRQWFELVATSN